MRYVFILLGILFLQCVSGQSVQYHYSWLFRIKRVIVNPVKRIDSIISIKIPDGKYQVSFVRPKQYHDYLLSETIKESIGNEMTFTYIQPYDFDYRKLWMEVKGVNRKTKWYKIIFKNNPRE